MSGRDPGLGGRIGTTVVETLVALLLTFGLLSLVAGVAARVQGVSGESYDRYAEATRRAAQQQLSGPPVEAQLIYRLATAVPEHWIPLVPVLIGSSGKRVHVVTESAEGVR